MKFIDKLKDLFTDEEEEFETKEIEIEEEKPSKLPTFMRNKIEAEEREKELIKEPIQENKTNDREVVGTRSSNFSFPIDMEDDYDVVYTPRNKNILEEIEESKPKAKTSVAELYSKKEEPKPKKFKPTPVISPIYGVLDKNYTKDEVKLQDESNYEIPRASKKVDFETVRNKAYGTLTDDIRNNLCENCELYKEVKITKKNGKTLLDDNINLLEDIAEEPKKDISIEEAAENYYDFGVDYEAPTNKSPSVISAEKVEIEVNNDIKIVNHNEEESSAEKIDVKEITELPEMLAESKTAETPKRKRKTVKEEKLLEDTKEFEKITEPEESIESILESAEREVKTDDKSNDNVSLDTDANDIFNLIDSMYDEEEK